MSCGPAWTLLEPAALGLFMDYNDKLRHEFIKFLNVTNLPFRTIQNYTEISYSLLNKFKNGKNCLGYQNGMVLREFIENKYWDMKYQEF